jgi:SAM-dependent methyltransferase
MHREGADLDQLASWCAGSANALDIATGAGHTAGALVDAGIPAVVASPSMVSMALESYPRCAGVVADAERLPFASDTFEAVTCRIAAHHFPVPRAFVREVARVLAPGGTFAFEDNIAPEDDELDAFLNRLEATRDPTHHRSYRPSVWTEWLEAAGLDVEETVQLMKPIEYDPWVNRIGTLDEADRATVERLLLEASEEVREFFEVEIDAGEVRSFGSLKGLIRARLD